MTAMTPAIDLFIDANILLLLAFCLWRVAQFFLQRTALRHDHGFQAGLLKTVLLITLLSPILGLGFTSLGNYLAPDTPTTLSDIAVAAYLGGSIAMPAVDFEALLNTRRTFVETFSAGKVSWAAPLLAGFAVVSVALTLRLLRSALCVRRTLADSYLWRRTGRVDIRLSDRITVPFAARGLRRRHVVLPTSLLTRPRDLRVVLAHEFQHLRAGDVEWELALEALRPLVFWNPAFILWKRAFEKLRELSCDQRVLASRCITPHEYAACLLTFCARRRTGPALARVAFVSVAPNTPKRVLEHRILSLYRLPSFRHTRPMLAALALVLALGIGSIAATVRAPGDWSQDRLMLSTIVNLERLDAITRQQGRATPASGLLGVAPMSR